MQYGMTATLDMETAGRRGDRVGRISTDTAECEYDAGSPLLPSCTGKTGVATATATGITVTVGVARGRRRHDEGGGTAGLFYQ